MVIQKMEIVTDHIFRIHGFSELIRVVLINNDNEKMVYKVKDHQHSWWLDEAPLKGAFYRRSIKYLCR